MASFLFLQGNATPFFAALAAKLAARGHRVRRINLNMGDRCYWKLPLVRDYVGTLEEFPSWLARDQDGDPADAMVLFGRWRPYHAAAIKVARACGQAVWNFDEAYLRPGYVTMELAVPDMLGEMPTTCEGLLSQSTLLPDAGQAAIYPSRFSERAAFDVAYHLLRALGQARFRHYQFHSSFDPFLEYVGYLTSALRTPARIVRAKKVFRAIRQSNGFYLYPMQVEGDFQIRARSTYRGNKDALREVIGSFAAHAPNDRLLIIKSHPLDPGLIAWRGVILSLARSAGVAERVHYLPFSDIAELVSRSIAVVTINSTVGMTALTLLRPVMALGQAVYNLPGLTYRGPLNSFWLAAQPPDTALINALRTILVAEFLIEGDFFSSHGRNIAARNAITRLEGPLPTGMRGNYRKEHEDLLL